MRSGLDTPIFGLEFAVPFCEYIVISCLVDLLRFTVRLCLYNFANWTTVV